FFGLLFLFTVSALFSQQIPQFSFRHQNLIINNPAIVGATGKNEIKLLHREQWVGFKNAPSTSFISFSQAINTTNGFGAYIMHDRTFPSSRFIVNASYSYIINMDNLNLAFGLSAMLMQYKFNTSELTYADFGDPSMQFVADQKWRPESNVGLLFYGQNFYAGFAINQIIKSNFRPYSSDDNGLVQMNRHFCLSGQYDLHIDEHRISPGIFMEYVKKAPFISEFSIMYSFDNQVFASLSYRYNDALSASIGYKYDRFYLAYAFDFTISKLSLASSSSHELMLAIDLSKSKTNIPMFGSGGRSRGLKNTQRIFY
ncbi:MAG: PorP/SprF family type IX secretion system membrane protein, partial [Bacteroidales bacterium]|nr:PorP/SprF family type IX secretion system membrane protein [Bacteroidales bacterium]